MLELKSTVYGILAGLMIAIGGTVYLSCESKVVGALLFSVALLTICHFGFSLYTGKIGFLVDEHGLNDVTTTFLGLLGNVLGCVLFALLIKAAFPNTAKICADMCTGKLEQAWYATLIRGLFCGVLMYVAVWIYKNKKSVLGIFVCIPVFILSGFEHSVADIFYFALSFRFDGASALFIILVVIGNSLGAMIIPTLDKLANLTKKESPEEERGQEKENG